MDTSGFLAGVGQVFGLVLSEFENVTEMIMSTELLFVPVLLAFFGGALIFVVTLLKKFGIRGLASSGRRRRR